MHMHAYTQVDAIPIDARMYMRTTRIQNMHMRITLKCDAIRATYCMALAEWRCIAHAVNCKTFLLPRHLCYSFYRAEVNLS